MVDLIDRDFKGMRFNIEGRGFEVTISKFNTVSKDAPFFVEAEIFGNSSYTSLIKQDDEESLDIKYFDHPDEKHIPHYVRFKTVLDAEEYYYKMVEEGKKYSKDFARIINAMLKIAKQQS